MADKTTFIKIDRNILNWRWFRNPRILSVFIWLLLKANIKDGSFEKETIPRGSLVTSNAHIAEGCGLTISNVRTALENLESTGEIERTVKNHYQIITVKNYELYQSGISKSIGQLASNLDGNLDSNSQATLIATRNNQRNKEYKEWKEGEKRNGRSAPDAPSEPKRGTDAFRAKSHLLLKKDEGTLDDIPIEYRNGKYGSYTNFADYWESRQ